MIKTTQKNHGLQQEKCGFPNTQKLIQEKQGRKNHRSLCNPWNWFTEAESEWLWTE